MIYFLLSYSEHISEPIPFYFYWCKQLESEKSLTKIYILLLKYRMLVLLPLLPLSLASGIMWPNVLRQLDRLTTDTQGKMCTTIRHRPNARPIKSGHFQSYIPQGYNTAAAFRHQQLGIFFSQASVMTHSV